MNFFEEQFDLLNFFQVSDSPRMEDLLPSSTVHQSMNMNLSRPHFKNKACENMRRISVFTPISLMQPKPKFVFIQTPMIAKGNTPLESGISKPTTVASQSVANNMIIPKSSTNGSLLHASSLLPSTNLSTIVKIESADEFNSTAPLLPWHMPSIEPKTKLVHDYLQYNTPRKIVSVQNMKKKQLKIKPACGSGSQRDNPWIDVPVMYMKQKQPKIESTNNGSQYSTPWKNVLVKNKKQEKVGYDYLQMMDTKLMELPRRCTICGAAFPTPQSLGGHMSAHVRKKKKVAVAASAADKVKEEN